MKMPGPTKLFGLGAQEAAGLVAHHAKRQIGSLRQFGQQGAGAAAFAQMVQVIALESLVEQARGLLGAASEQSRESLARRLPDVGPGLLERPRALT